MLSGLLLLTLVLILLASKHTVIKYKVVVQEQHKGIDEEEMGEKLASRVLS